MQLTSSPRRALGLVAVSALGMSTAVLGVTGTASAEPAWEAPYTFSTDPNSGADHAGVSRIGIEGTDCTVAWIIGGAGGGDGYDPEAGETVPGELGWQYMVSTTAADGARFDLFPGKAGEDATDGHTGLGGASGATSTNSAGGSTGFASGGIYGGGGGAASLVELGGDYILAAGGGNGGFAELDSSGEAGAGGFNGGSYDGTTSTDGLDNGPTYAGDGVISGQVTCGNGGTLPPPSTPVTPAAPVISDYVEVGDGVAKVRFTPGAHSDGSHGTAWEFQLDGGSWTEFDPGFTNNDDLTLTLSELTNLKTYAVSVRASSEVGHGAASAPVTFMPFRPVAAPAGVSATVGISSVKVSWTKAADSTGTAKFRAFAIPEGAQSSADVAFCDTADATTTSCLVGVKPGLAYEYGVVGLDKAGNQGDFAYGEAATAVVPGPTAATTVPKADGTLTSDAKDGKSTAGGQVTVTGTGFLPGSTVALVVYSTPVKLGEAVVLADGTFSATVTLPKDLANGAHHLVATGVDANGNTRNLVVEVTVSGGTAAVTAGPALAKTGFSALPWAGAGALALLAGGGLVLGARRRTAA